MEGKAEKKKMGTNGNSEDKIQSPTYLTRSEHVSLYQVRGCWKEFGMISCCMPVYCIALYLQHKQEYVNQQL